jgi:predicted glycosyltransferase involved in capsule biosynthesis
VGDVDMIFKSNFIDKACQLKEARKVIYFQVGFLSHSESLQNKDFSNYLINHFSTKDATGISMFPKSLLMEINGYDEFYHGWGSEDTDVHNRINKLGVPIHFYDSEVLLLHQWHEKSYRTLKSDYPFHTALERENQQYLEYMQTRCSSKATIGQDWGLPTVYKAY